MGTTQVHLKTLAQIQCTSYDKHWTSSLETFETFGTQRHKLDQGLVGTGRKQTTD